MTTENSQGRPLELLDLPPELLYKIGEHTLDRSGGRNGGKEPHIRRFRLTCSKLAEILLPLQWVSHNFGRYNEAPCESTKNLQDDPQLCQYVRDAQWHIEADVEQPWVPIVLRSLPNLETLFVLNRPLGSDTLLPRIVKDTLKHLPLHTLTIDNVAGNEGEPISFGSDVPTRRRLTLNGMRDTPFVGGDFIQYYKTEDSVSCLQAPMRGLKKLWLWDTNESFEAATAALQAIPRSVELAFPKLRILDLSPSGLSSARLHGLLRAFSAVSAPLRIHLRPQGTWTLDPSWTTNAQLPSVASLHVQQGGGGQWLPIDPERDYLLRHVELLLPSFPNVSKLTLEGDWTITSYLLDILQPDHTPKGISHYTSFLQFVCNETSIQDVIIIDKRQARKSSVNIDRAGVVEALERE